MERDDFKLAQHTLDIYGEMLTPVYREMTEQLAGRLAANEMQLDRMREGVRAAELNYGIVRDFVARLPGDKKSFCDATVANAAEARLFEANTISTPMHDFGPTGPHIARYVIGRRPGAVVGTSDLLLAATDFLPQSYDDPTRTQTVRVDYFGTKWKVDFSNLVVHRVWDDEFDLAFTTAQRNIAMSYTEEELESRFDPGSGSLTVSPVVITADTYKQSRPVDKKPRQHWSPKRLYRSVTRGINTLPVERTAGEFMLTDKEISEFRVLDNLNRLAVAFNKTHLLANLLEQGAQSAPAAYDGLA